MLLVRHYYCKNGCIFYTRGGVFSTFVVSKLNFGEVMSIKKKTLILIVVTALMSVVFFIFYKIITDNLSVDSLSISEISGKNASEDKKKWAELMDEIGIEKAYRQFKSEYENIHFGRQHTMAHIIGELIYEKAGIQGIVFCDATFAFGCYHSFFGRALAEIGPDIISEMDKSCIDKFGPLGTGCQHGIGHGLMEYFGHDNLLAALDACSATFQKKPLFGCSSGVFMEYNVPIIITADNTSTRPRMLDKSIPYNPCPGLPSKYQESCYYEIVQWWDKEGNYTGDYKKIGQLCQDILEQKNRESCFLGVGNMVAQSSEYDVTETVIKCGEMPIEDSRLLCRSGGSWSFFSSVRYMHLAPRVCDDLALGLKAKCVQDSDLIGNGEILNIN